MISYKEDDTIQTVWPSVALCFILLSGNLPKTHKTQAGRPNKHALSLSLGTWCLATPVCSLIPVMFSARMVSSFSSSECSITHPLSQPIYTNSVKYFHPKRTGRRNKRKGPWVDFVSLSRRETQFVIRSAMVAKENKKIQVGKKVAVA